MKKLLLVLSLILIVNISYSQHRIYIPTSYTKPTYIVHDVGIERIIYTYYSYKVGKTLYINTNILSAPRLSIPSNKYVNSVINRSYNYNKGRQLIKNIIKGSNYGEIKLSCGCISYAGRRNIRSN
jgi:hypothetical protein